MAWRAVLTVASVLRASPTYDAEYVQRLRDGVAAHLSAPHEFVCLSDVPVPCRRIELEHDWGGWWAKLELFKLEPPVLYFDLDTIITGDLTEIAAHAARAPFTTLRDFYREKGIGSGMMAWAEPVKFVYDKFAEDPQGVITALRAHGDQAFLERVASPAKWQDVMPGQVVSYKADWLKRPCEDARVVCFHGKPKPRDIGWRI